jgi:hypothetical protein
MGGFCLFTLRELLDILGDWIGNLGLTWDYHELCLSFYLRHWTKCPLITMYICSFRYPLLNDFSYIIYVLYRGLCYLISDTLY